MVYADTGEALTGLSAEEAMTLMRRYVPEHATSLEYERRLTDSDQWTLQSLIRNQMPMHRIALGDRAIEYVLARRQINFQTHNKLVPRNNSCRCRSRNNAWLWDKK